jgi:CRP-like cAMP-binding protein
MTPQELAQVGRDAEQALNKGENKRALQLFVQLERLDPKNPRWPMGVALVLRRFGQRPQEAEALMRAVKIYADAGDTVHVLATVKSVLAIDPQHQEARRAMAIAAHREHSKSPSSQVQAPQRIVPGSRVVPIEDLSLHKIVPGASIRASQTTVGAVRTGVYAIPLPDDDDDRTLRFEPPSQGFVPPPPEKEDESITDEAFDLVAREVRSAEKAQEILPTNPLFSKLDAEALDKLVLGSEVVELEQGKEIFRQGAKGDALYVVAEGMVAVIDEGPPKKMVGRIGPGEFFGEIALITNHPRSATIAALMPTQLIQIDRKAINEVIAHDPSALTTLLSFIRDRLASKVLASHPLFAPFSPPERERLKTRFRFLELEPGATMIREGKMAEGLFVLISGECDVVRDEKWIGMLGPGEIAGEMSLVSGQPANANVKVKKKTLAIELSQKDFLAIIGARPQARQYVEALIQKRTGRVRWG